MNVSVWADKVPPYIPSAGIVIAALFFFYWYVFAGSLENALWRSVAVLVVAYPFLLTRAAPAVFASGIERARRAGITFKDKASLENLNQANVVVFNKTGTLTVGNPQLTDFVVFDDALPLPEALHLAASLEGKSAHPLARALVEKGKTLARGLATPFEYKEMPGMGVSGVVNGKHIEIGNLSFLEGLAGSVRGQGVGFSRLQNEGKTVVFMFVEKKLAALIAFTDALRPFAKEAVAALRKQGKEVVLLTGDSKTTSESFARSLGISAVYSELPSSDKTRIVAVIDTNEIRTDTNAIVYTNDDIRNVASAFSASKKVILTVKLITILQLVWYAIAFGFLLLF